MNELTKKRTKAIGIDLAISSIVTAGVEYLLRKKVKSEAVHNLVTPTAVLWALEYVQLSCNGQTLGYKAMGLTLQNEDGQTPTCSQIAKRMVYRDTVSTIDYLKDRKGFEGEDGSVLPHDRYAGTLVREEK
ncbi:RDD family protein [Saliterribacillus persicus]|uniref:Putative RDD family membrane protein YckC n=1 Tax=Saliterribacillus persicus TaxID=930114 RepID=A0A368Y4C8_9BACI|nr:RDD family protein [Saliterribacillus persicus]RCW74955.1 putative RDD family membrane protein YckC [Saliterribacillus persicus]